MKRIKALSDKRAQALEQMKAVQQAAETENRTPTADEQAKFDSLKADVENIDKQIENVRYLIEADRQQAATRIADEKANGKADGVVAGGISVKDRWTEDPKKGFKSHVEFYKAVMQAGRTGKADERLQFLATAGSDEHGAYSDPYGGFLVPEGFMPGLMTTSSDADFIAPLTTKVPMTTPVLSINARVDKNHSTSVSGGLRVYRRAEADTVTASRMQFQQIKLEATGLFGLAYTTEEILSRSPISIVALLQQGFADEFGSRLIYERLNGTGAGEYLGINNTAAKIDVAKEAGQAADTITFENIIKMRARVWGYQNAIWMANHDCLPQLMLLNQSVGTAGVPVWQPSAREDHPDMLLGRPLYFSEYLATVGDVGDIICANWTQYLEGTLRPLESAESMHVRFVNAERTFRFWTENAGSPWWSGVLTPKNGATLAPFVRLAAR